ncbi:phospholipase D-like domain-containing protein [Chloroflexota bacterium]
MLSQKDSGNNKKSEVVQLANIIKTNPWLQLTSLNRNNLNLGRTPVERESIKLVKSIGIDKSFSLSEVIDLMLLNDDNTKDECNLLISPAEILDSVSAGQRVKSLSNFLEEIISRACREIVILSPFWDISTIIDLLRCIPRREQKPELILALVSTKKHKPNVEDVVTKIQSTISLNRIRLLLHVADGKSVTEYPHAKCLIVDQRYSYIGSANFTMQGLSGHFEVGVSLGEEDSIVLSNILSYIYNQSGLFKLSWDSTLKS